MRKTRTELTGEDHPTLDDPSPLDACGWCLGWIAEDADRGFTPLQIDADAVSEDAGVVDLRIGGHLVVAAVVPPAAADPQVTGLEAIVVLCSDECQLALRAALANDEARSRGDTVPPRTVADDERLDAEALLKEHCAWCLAPIADDAPVETVSASMNGPLDAGPGVIGVSIAGRRIHAVVPPAGFPLTEGHDLLFVLCGPGCAQALVEAVDAERTLRRTH